MSVLFLRRRVFRVVPHGAPALLGLLAVSAGAPGAALSAGRPAAARQTSVAAPGAPDPSLMVLQPADLAPGTKVITQGDSGAPGFAAGYRRVFGPTTAPDGATFASTVSEVDVAHSPAEAAADYRQFDAAFSSRSGRRVLARDLVQSLNRAGRGRLHLSARRVRTTRSALGAPGDSFVISIALPVGRRTVRSDLIVVREDRTIALLGLTFLNRSDRRYDAGRLAAIVVGHIRAVLVSNQSPPPPAAGTSSLPPRGFSTWSVAGRGG